MSEKEAKARIKINKLLEESGWRFFDDENGVANIELEQNVKITENHINEFGENFEKIENGFADFTLLDEMGFPLIVLEAKSEKKDPLVGKEQARRYAKELDCRFIILSNGNIHYFWDLEQGNPYIITKFPTANSMKRYYDYKPDSKKLIDDVIDDEYIALTQMPNYAKSAEWKDESLRDKMIEKNKLRFLRPYQIKAIQSIQSAISAGGDRFLFEMATGTGKTLTAAAVIKLFLRSSCARRVLFLVDRLELEDQAQKAFNQYLKNDYKTVIYKQNRDDWNKAEIVVTTVQSLLFNNKYKKLFSPTDFDLVISDEAHRSIGGNARAVFEYFIGYKLGLTATPKDYIKNTNESENNPRNRERRLLLDTYKTFGCESGDPTFRYLLLDGVKQGFLINPIIVDARTEVSTQLLSDKGFVVEIVDDEGKDAEESFKQRDFEKKFFSEDTNRVLCKTFLENALLDPITGEIGKTIIFAVSQKHATKITQILNAMADKMFPNKYKSDFAMQITSVIPYAQQYTINFANNNLSGSALFNQLYKTSKTRVCVTVGMMTTGYDCSDILNLCMMRPIFSPTDFIQIKGRGTRKHNFLELLFDEDLKESIAESAKETFKLFDFFANCEYFEKEFDYDEKLKLPQISESQQETTDKQKIKLGEYEIGGIDVIHQINEKAVGYDGMKIDRMFFEKFEDKLSDDEFIKNAVSAGDIDQNIDKVVEYVESEIMDKPNEFFTLDKLRKSGNIDWRISLKQLLSSIFNKETIPTKKELLEDEFQKFVSDKKPESANIAEMKYFFNAYATDKNLQGIIDSQTYTELYVNPSFNLDDFKAVPEEWRKVIPEYIKDYVSLNQFV